MTRFDLSRVTTPFIELNDLKRITSAGRPSSIATRLFADAWAALVGGVALDAVAGSIVGRGLAAARLGDLDATVLLVAGVPRPAVRSILIEAAEAVAGDLLVPLRSMVEQGFDRDDRESPAGPAFVAALAMQPRAGITCPGKPRIMLEPPENHAEHCLMVALYGVLLSPLYGADPGRVFLAGLAHHFHNAGMPDSGFTGEVLLGPYLKTLMDHHTAACLAQLSPALRHTVEQARAVLPDTTTPEGQAFHAADVLDRVLQLNQYMRASALTPERMLGEMELVHAGPVKGFQDEVLRQAGLL
ncbi:hypothetical protein P7D22_00910 [Lichenihabitans sp. Uapishka_5]|uniref:hypothetical protein n=1 Tax=Lichenihabitans sp. Uapishka_5 TaxID=3037302 RepID=UPI0029E802D3|nr:hypothetical protein [Lichenihabitans sp. Uapishka_5]MDX7949737.1 hypothetical protein [Lichenihabitans sp. Uapishka_5]